MELSHLLHYWDTVRETLFEALDKLTDSQLDFTPAPGLWSLRRVACHIALAEEGWFRYQVTRELDDWPEINDAEAVYPSVASVKVLLEEVHARTRAFLSEDGEAKMAMDIPVTWGNSVKLEWIVWHVLEHEIHHRGEIFLMLGLQGIEAPDV
jgi:uncharacterized damage-inducible protein DinB